MNIPAYFYTRSDINGFDFYNYLNIKGGSCKEFNGPLGGEYHFLIYYLMPEIYNDLNYPDHGQDIRSFLKSKNIPFGLGASIEDAYTSLLSQLDEFHPLKK